MEPMQPFNREYQEIMSTASSAEVSAVVSAVASSAYGNSWVLMFF